MTSQVRARRHDAKPHPNDHHDTLAQPASKSLQRTKSTGLDRFLGVAIFVIAVGINLNTMSNGFVFDDDRAIVKNPDLRPDTPIANLLKDDYWGYDVTWMGY